MTRAQIGGRRAAKVARFCFSKFKKQAFKTDIIVLYRKFTSKQISQVLGTSASRGNRTLLKRVEVSLRAEAPPNNELFLRASVGSVLIITQQCFADAVGKSMCRARYFSQVTNLVQQQHYCVEYSEQQS
jgi:hypothetical protein